MFAHVWLASNWHLKLIVDNYGPLKSLQVISGRHMEDNVCFGNKFTGRRRSCKGGALIEYKIIEKLIGNVFTQVALLKRWPIQQVWLYSNQLQFYNSHHTLHITSPWPPDLAGTLTRWPWPIFHAPVTLTQFTLMFQIFSTINLLWCSRSSQL